MAKANRGDSTAAERELNQGLKLDGTGWFPAYASACVAFAQRDWTATSVAARACVIENPKWPSGWSLLAMAAEHCGDLRSAEEAYRAFMERAESATEVAWARRGYWRVHNALPVTTRQSDDR